LLPARLKPPAPPPIEKIPSAPAETAASAIDSDSGEESGSAAASTGEKVSGNEPSSDAHIVQIKRSQTAFEIARNYLGRSNWKAVDQIRALNPQIRGGYQMLPAGTRVVLPGPGPSSGKGRGNQQMAGPDANSSSTRVSFTGNSNMVRVHRQETLFQFALDQYGKSGWEIVGRIRALNPQLRDPYQVLQEGQWIRVPELAQER
jgi:phage tail protein X